MSSLWFSDLDLFINQIKGKMTLVQNIQTVNQSPLGLPKGNASRLVSTSQDLQNSSLAKNNYSLSKDGDYPIDGKNYILKAQHEDKDLLKKFFELVKWRLHNAYSLTITEGYENELYLSWSRKPKLWQLEDIVKSIRLVWSLVTVFD